MLDTLSREGLSLLTRSANAVVPTAAVGLVTCAEGNRASVVVSEPHRVSEYVVPIAELPPALVPGGADARYGDARALRTDSEGIIEWQLTAAGVRTVVSLAVQDDGQPARCWIGLSEDVVPSPDQLRQLATAVSASLPTFGTPPEPAGTMEQLGRLEATARLLPALLSVLDIREIFDRLSAISHAALEHDMLTVGLLNDDYTALTVYARTGDAPDLGRVFPQQYPPAVTRAWQVDIIDDRAAYPLERDRPPTTLGMRSSLRLAFPAESGVKGGIGFHSRETAKYSSADAGVGRRLAAYVAVALSHQRLAEEGRRDAALRERTASLDLLDGLLNTITGVLDVREVFDRIFEVSQPALPHDAMIIAMPIGDGTRVLRYATTGALRHLPVPFEAPLGDLALVTREWDSVVIDDVLTNPFYASLPAAQSGMRSLLTIPVRLEEQLRAWINFWSRAPGRFTRDDVAMARRISAHITLALSHQRLAEQQRRTEELRARTTNLELLEKMLDTLIDAGGLRDVFDKISAIAGKVLAHDAAALMVRLPDGRRARLYASAGVPAGMMPEETEIPEELLRNPNWEHDILDDLTQLPDPRYVRLVAMGFHSLLRVPIRLEGQFAGGLVFLSKTGAAFKHDDVLVARRMADRMAVTMARDREVQASRRADEATARAARLEARVRALTEELDSRTGYRRVVGESPQWRQVLTQAAQVAATDTTVLLLGESGTGKEVLARFLHRGSPRGNGPFIALNCAALPEQLLEAELFGYERGAYTGATQSKPGQLEQAAGGTLFLDEVAEMSPSAQAKFLRVLQEREFQRLGGTRVLRADVRIVAATNRDLLRSIAQGHFREDLYYRLNVFAIRLPPLRDRRDDILPLSEAFLTEIGRGLGRPPGGISRDARQMLVECNWPGNVRELRNILERAAILCDGGLITPEHLAITVPPLAARPAALSGVEAAGAAPVKSPPPAPVPPSSSADLQSMERAMIEQALQQARFNKSKAAKALGLTRHQLYIRMRKYGFD
jgi:transcriptional regulator with GAF, ATPase, and Fis domain